MPELKLEMDQIRHTPSTNKKISTGGITKQLTVGWGVKIPGDAKVGKNVTITMYFSGIPSEVLSLLKDYPLDPNLEKKAKILCTLSTNYQTSADIITAQAEKKVEAKETKKAKEKKVKPPSSLEAMQEKIVEIVE